MSYKISNWFIFLLSYIAKRIVIQSHHQGNITKYFEIIIKESKEQFTEDNRPTQISFLQECFDDAIKRVHNEKKI